MKFSSIGAVDLHFHGAFGIDVMSATHEKFEELSTRLWQEGVAGFCPTTLSSPADQLSLAVKRIGDWITKGKHPGAKPLGIHLEGPFINSQACGAHPPLNIRPFNWDELKRLWEISQGTLKILTIAPENIPTPELKRLSDWCDARNIHLSIGHSLATETQAKLAFNKGFHGVTHTWNALPFHHRNPGTMGAALGTPRVYLELIIDQIHVSPTLIRWTLNLHPPKFVYFVSDCLSRGGYGGACRMPDGRLAGGGLLLTHSYTKWVEDEARFRKWSLSKTVTKTIPHLTTIPLKILGIPSRTLSNRSVLWQTSQPDCVTATPVRSK